MTMKFSSCVFVILCVAYANCLENQEASTAEKNKSGKNALTSEDEEEIKIHANPGKQTRKDLKNVAGIMLEEVGLPFFSWPTFGVLKDAAKTIFGVTGKSNKRPAAEDEYDNESASLQNKELPAKLKKQTN